MKGKKILLSMQNDDGSIYGPEEYEVIVWLGRVILPDGRAFATDGEFYLDLGRVAKFFPNPWETLPDRVLSAPDALVNPDLPPAADEFPFADLIHVPSEPEQRGPRGIAVRKEYCGEVFGACCTDDGGDGGVLVRSHGAGQPVYFLQDGQLVAMVMPVGWLMPNRGMKHDGN